MADLVDTVYRDFPARLGVAETLAARADRTAAELRQAVTGAVTELDARTEALTAGFVTERERAERMETMLDAVLAAQKALVRHVGIEIDGLEERQAEREQRPGLLRRLWRALW